MNSTLIFTLIAFVFVALCLISGKIGPSVACGIAVIFLWFVGVLDMTTAFENFIGSNIIVMVGMMALPIGGAAASYLTKNQMAANVGCLEELGF